MTQRLMNCNVDIGDITSIFLSPDGFVYAVVAWRDYNKETVEKVEGYKGKMPNYNTCVCLDGELGWGKE